MAKTYSNEKVTLLNDIYQAVVSRHKHVYIINASLLSNQGLWRELHSTDLSSSILDSQIRNSIWKSILQIALHV